MREEEIKLVIGGLLHDIGKVVLRQGGSHERHSRLGAEYLKEKAGISDREILDCVRYHHTDEIRQADLPENSPAWIICMADNIASAADRRKADDGRGGFDLYTPMQPVFNLLNGNHGNAWYSPEFLNPQYVNYPTEEKRNYTAEQYQSILGHITANLKGIAWTNEYIHSLLEVLEANLSYVPSSTSKEEIPDISLYDHMKLTAGMALCIKAYLDEGARNYKDSVYNHAQDFYKEKCFRLASMDISGIQKFIYTIPSKNALKSLRARSFYLDLLMEHITDELLEREGLARTNLIYSGGGHCYLLLPNTKEAALIFESFLDEVNRWFLKFYHTQLYIAGGSIACSSVGLQNEPEGSYGKLFRELSTQISSKKSHRYSAEQLIALNKEKAEDYTRECTSCKNLARVNTDGLCPVCAALKQLSNHILYSEFFSVVREEEPQKTSELSQTPDSEKEEELPLPFGCVLTDDSEESLKKRMASDPSFVRAYAKNRSFTGKRIATKLWVGDYTTGETFGELAEKSTGGFKRIGILRADVDNLGQAFVSGFRDPGNRDRYNTLTRTAAFSRQMSMFFKLYINDILAHPVFTIDGVKKEKRNIAVVYSGGDDVFLAGSWDDVIEAAIDLRNDLRTYTERTLTISAGIGIYEPTFPVSVMASETAELEEKSKHLPGKDAVTIFEDGETHPVKENGVDYRISDGTYQWEEFTGEVLGEKYKALETFFKNSGERGSAFIYRLLDLIRHQEERINFARYVYILSRLEPDSKSPAKEKEAYRNFETEMVSWIQNEKDRRQLKTAMNIYVYLHREEDQA